MAVVKLDVTVDNKRPVLRLKAIQDRIGTVGMVAFLQGFAGPMLRERAQARFAEEGDEASGKWRPLAPSTIRRRESAGQVPIRINDRTGVMRAWVEGAAGKTYARSGSAIFEWPGTPTNRLVGTKLKTAQEGNAAARTPARPVIAISAEDYAKLLAGVTAWLGGIP